MSAPAPRPVAWESLPLVLHVPDMAALLGVQRSTIWRRCATRRMRPKPYAWTRPYVWYRDAVRAEFERGIARLPVPRPHRRRRADLPASEIPPAAPLTVRDVMTRLTRDLARVEDGNAAMARRD